MKTYPLLVIIVLIALSFVYFQDHDVEIITSNVVKEYTSPIKVYFCPADNCSAYMRDYIAHAHRIHCAFYELNLMDIISALEERSASADVKLFTDTDYRIGLDFERSDNRSSLMHNKFCIFDGRIVWTGSMNPTENGNYRNNNNVVVFESESMAAVFEAEFKELWDYQEDISGIHEFSINNIPIEVYFCPEDWCANKVILELGKAESSIYFMTFSFTHDLIGDMLVQKHSDGIHVEGLFESRGISQYSEFQKLNQSNITVYKDTNPNTMHHKVFIIDSKTVITGSFNPTANADERNDENLIIVHDEGIAGLFMDEYGNIRP
ncbi:hypothetical protein JW968_04845 [Candidatus Woesearchaeota archaeon]|nr:hypothetical protein [Candidatus Woesearchaeota archaeon]